MDVYGLTGGIGSGKSTVAELLEEYGVPVVSADELSRVVVAPGSEGLRAVVEAFGPEILDDRGELDRRRMADVVFRDVERRRELEAILHPRIRDRFEQVLDALEKAGHEVAVYEVPLLFERNLQGEMKAVILVTAPIERRVARVRARDDVTETEVRARIAAQMDEDQKRRRADYIIENNGSIDDLRREVEFLMARFLRLSTSARRPGMASAPGATGLTMPPFRDAEAGEAGLPSRRPTAVPTSSPARAPGAMDLDDDVPLLEPDEDVRSMGPPTIVETGPPRRARPEPPSPPSKGPAPEGGPSIDPAIDPATDSATDSAPDPAASQRVTRIDGSAPSSS